MLRLRYVSLSVCLSVSVLSDCVSPPPPAVVCLPSRSDFPSLPFVSCLPLFGPWRLAYHPQNPGTRRRVPVPQVQNRRGCRPSPHPVQAERSPEGLHRRPIRRRAPPIRSGKRAGFRWRARPPKRRRRSDRGRGRHRRREGHRGWCRRCWDQHARDRWVDGGPDPDCHVRGFAALAALFVALSWRACAYRPRASSCCCCAG